MAKGIIAPFLEHASVNNDHRGCALVSSERPSSRDTSTSRTSSVLSSVVFPYLRRLDISDDMPTHQKKPLITLKLSSPSFLDSVVNDGLTPHPLYVIQTVGTSTTISRNDPWEGVTGTADIKWPKLIPTKGKGKESVGVLVQMSGGRWKGAENLLKPSSRPNSSSKFNIPNYHQTLKWRRVGAAYWCTSSSIKGPIATFDPAVESVPPRLKIYETLHDKYDARPLLVHAGVSILLLDYLLITSLLLVTDVQEWMLVKKYEGYENAVSRPATSSTTDNDETPKSTVSTSASQWRKILYGEPLYPKLSPESALSSYSTSHTPTSADQMAKIVYGDPLFPTLRTPSPDLSMSESDEDEKPKRTPSPSAESFFYNLPNASAPSHTHLDPTFYDTKTLPPVPPIPAKYRSDSSRSQSPNCSTPTSAGSLSRLRELPAPPRSISAPSQPWPRPRSTPPRATTYRGDPSLSSTLPGVSSSVPGSSRPSHFPVIRTHSMSMRRLPRPPREPTEVPPRTPTLSHGQRENSVPTRRPREKQTPKSGPRSLPPTPISTTALGPQWAGSTLVAVDAETAPVPQHYRRTQKSEDLSNWTLSPHQHPTGPRNGSFDIPPPAYTSINFAAASPTLEVTMALMPQSPSEID